MSYENHPSTTSTNSQAPKKNNNKAVIYGVLIAALLGTWGYIIYDKSKSNEELAKLQAQVGNVDSARTVLQDEFNETLTRMDSLTGSNTQLTGVLAERQAEIERLKKEISSVIRSKNGDLSKARNLIDQLKGQVTDLVAEVERLKGENQELTASNQQLTTERDTLNVQKQRVEQSLTTTEAERRRLEDVGSTLHASGFNIAAINVKGSGKEKSTTTAKRADVLRVSFQLDENRVAASGSKELYVVMTDPSGNVVSIPAFGSGSFQTREEGEKVYTNKVTVNYEQGKSSPVSFDWKQDRPYQAGQYKIQIYQNGYKIGEGVKNLKKGGLFS